MFSIILAFLRGIKPRTVAIIALAVFIFGAGWTANGWRYKAKLEAERTAIAKSYAKQNELFMRKYREKLNQDQAAAEALSADLEQVRQERRVLEEKLRGAAVVKTDDEICKGGRAGNVFGPDFARLWNAGASDN